MELNTAFSIEGVGTFRISAFRQKGSPAVVVRYIPGDIPQLDSLGLPEVLKEVIMEKRGLILMVGATGSGKSTSLSAMLDFRNERKSGPHPDPRGPGRIHLQEQEIDRQPARGRHRHQGVRDRAAERAAPGAGLHPDRRDPRQADHGDGARLRAVRPPVPRHAAREQQLPRDEPDHQLLPAGEPAEPAARPVGGAAGGDLAAPGAHQDRRSAWRRSRCCSTRATSPS